MKSMFHFQKPNKKSPSWKRGLALVSGTMLALTLVSALSTMAHNSAWANSSNDCTIYREVFPILNTGGTTPKDIVFIQKWYGEQHGSAIVDAASQDPQRSDNGLAPEMQPVDSNPVGNLVPNTGGAFYSPSAVAGIYIFTDEFSADVSTLRRVRFDSRNNGCSTFVQQNSTSCQKVYYDSPTNSQLSFDPAAQSAMHVALRIGTTWYIAEQVLEQSAYNPATTPGGDPKDPIWQTHTFDFAGKTFLIANSYDEAPGGECESTVPNCLPRGNGPSGQTLPLSGTVNGIGIWIEKNQPAPRLPK